MAYFYFTGTLFLTIIFSEIYIVKYAKNDGEVRI